MHTDKHGTVHGFSWISPTSFDRFACVCIQIGAIGNLDFAYSVTGDTAWKPLRVYNDGQKTIIQMPSIMAQTEAPTLLLLNKEGGIFSEDETVMVNYRLQGDRYIVDTVFDKAILIAGVGGNQSRVTITRGN